MKRTNVNEEWVVIPEFPNYELNKNGVIRNLYRGKIVTPYFYKGGFGRYVFLYIGRTKSKQNIDYLVKSCFGNEKRKIKVNEYVDSNGECWQSITAHPTHSVSDLGNIKCEKTGIIETTTTDIYGYSIVTLVSYDRKFSLLVQDLVSKHFMVDPPFAKEGVVFSVDHIDENRANNRVDNLRWAPRWKVRQKTLQSMIDRANTN